MSRKRTLEGILLIAATALQGCAHRPATPHRWNTQARPLSADPTFTPEEERLLEEASRALERADCGSQEDDVPQRLSTRFPGNRLALLLDELVRRRSDCALAEADSRSATAESTPPSRIDPDAARQAFLEARLLIEKGRREDACAHLENALALDPENEEFREALVSLAKQLGLELYGKGNSHKASVYWRRVLEIRPEDEEAKKFLLRANRVLENR